MNQQFRYRQFPSGNPLANLLVVLAGILVISFAVTIGFFVFLGVTGFLLFTAAVIGVRRWWQRRVLRRGGQGQSDANGRGTHVPTVIEGEYLEYQIRDEDRANR